MSKTKLNKLNKELPAGTRAIALATTKEERFNLIDEYFPELAEMDKEKIIEDIMALSVVDDYLYTHKQVEAVERALYEKAISAEKETDQLKAIDSFLDRVKGKATQKTDVTSNGKTINFTFDSAFKDRE